MLHIVFAFLPPNINGVAQTYAHKHTHIQCQLIGQFTICQAVKIKCAKSIFQFLLRRQICIRRRRRSEVCAVATAAYDGASKLLHVCCMIIINKLTSIGGLKATAAAAATYASGCNLCGDF